MLRLELVDAQGHSEVLGVTGNHPFWVRNRGWTKAEDLLDGDEIFSSRGGWVKVGSASWFAHSQTVYNLEVDGFHTYFVGASGAWVHNGGCRAPEFFGGELNESQFLDNAIDYLGEGYTEESPGRFVSEDGLRQVRYGRHEVSSALHHAHFEAFERSYFEGGRVVENTAVRLLP